MSVPLTVSGLLESSLYVEDLDRSLTFYQRVFAFKALYREADRMCGLSVGDKQVLLLFTEGGSTEPTETSGGRIPPHDGRGNLHLAFAIDRSDIEPWRQRLRQQSVAIESEVDCASGGHSIYFRDPDGHLVELITSGCWPIF